MSSATIPLLDDEVLPFSEEDDLQNPNSSVKKISHPYVAFFHVFFRGAAMAIYLFCGLFNVSFITTFVFVILLLSADFWTVKNITGRLLVGLRWWNYVDDNGISHWVYEAKKGKINGKEARIFWFALILCPVFWILLFIVAIFGLKFKWLLLVVIALSLNGANLYGYVKCKFGANKDLNSAASDFVKTQIFKNAMDIIAKPNAPTTVQATSVI